MCRPSLCHALVLLLALVSVSAPAQTTPVPPLLNFQGRLAKPDGTPVPNGTYSVTFTLFDALTGGNPKWTETDSVTVHNGVFAVRLGSLGAGLPAGAFNGDLWLEIKVGTGAPLIPRQQLVSVAYALKANTVPDGSIGAAQIASGSITADKLSSNLLNPLVWLLEGNANTDPTKHFLGTTDNQPVVFKANGRQVLRLDPLASVVYDATHNYRYYGSNITGGYGGYQGNPGNSLTAGVVAGTIAGGGLFDSNGNISDPNAVTDIGGTVGGGAANTAGNGNADVTDALWATVGGGLGNTASGTESAVGGGVGNSASGLSATVAGGGGNTASDQFTSVGGGGGNIASAAAATVGGGLNNRAFNAYTTIGGGYSNKANAGSATVGGGSSNAASGLLSTVPGGFNNFAAGNYSFAAGQQAQALHDSAFVWNDNANGSFVSSGPDQFLIHAIGGVGINTNSPNGFALNVNGTANFAGSITVNGTSYTSDARYKTHIATFENALDAILNLRGVTFDWDRDAWKGMNFPDGRQVGFIAQEVEKVLPELVSTDGNGYKAVAYPNVVPILVEAVRALNTKMDEKQRQVDELKARNAAIETRLAALARAVRKLQNDRR
jgi:hypothetical protein